VVRYINKGTQVSSLQFPSRPSALEVMSWLKEDILRHRRLLRAALITTKKCYDIWWAWLALSDSYFLKQQNSSFAIKK
jgi:hypothetical protein